MEPILKKVTIGSCLLAKMTKSLPTGKSHWSLENDRHSFHTEGHLIRKEKLSPFQSKQPSNVVGINDIFGFI